MTEIEPESEEVIEFEPELEAVTDGELQPEEVIEVEPELEAVLDGELQPEEVIEVESELETVLDGELQPEDVIEFEPEPEPVIEIEPESEEVIEVEPGAIIEVESELEAVLDGEPEPEDVIEVEPEPDPVTEIEPESDDVIEVEPEPEDVIEVELEPEAAVEAEPEQETTELAPETGAEEAIPDKAPAETIVEEAVPEAQAATKPETGEIEDEALQESEPEAEIPVDSTIDSSEVAAITGQASIWGAGPTQRGRLYEDVKGANIGGNFPTIDDFDEDTGVATSYKTIDLTAESYQSPSALTGRLHDCIDPLSEFEGKTWHLDGEAIEVEGDSVEEKILAIGVPPGVCTKEQAQALTEAKEYASQKGVKLIIEEVA